jgi:predicted nucleic acid-binding protein
MERGHAAKTGASAFRFTSLVRPTQTIDAVPEDPNDNRVLECAVTAGSRYIVTGDSALLRLGKYEGIEILRVADFIRLINP